MYSTFITTVMQLNLVKFSFLILLAHYFALFIKCIYSILYYCDLLKLQSQIDKVERMVQLKSLVLLFALTMRA